MSAATGLSLNLPAWPEVDFAAFGEVEAVPLSRIQKLTAGYLSRNWVAIPQVTHHDDADISALDGCRARLANETGKRVTPVAFMVKALVEGLRAFPSFNASLDASGQTLILKKYFHVGIAVDTPAGLLVAVIRNCDKKGVVQIADEIADISARARTKGLPMTDMLGGCMTVSSLGHIGGTAFSPIINAPEVAILGVSKAQWKPQRAESANKIDWRMMLPLSLTYDHRVINGADAARFVAHVAAALSQPDTLVE
jgi:pyruvate dehydrogenase E2 component (dihydrolipoamide acetyltransferase)